MPAGVSIDRALLRSLLVTEQALQSAIAERLGHFIVGLSTTAAASLTQAAVVMNAAPFGYVQSGVVRLVFPLLLIAACAQPLWRVHRS